MCLKNRISTEPNASNTLTQRASNQAVFRPLRESERRVAIDTLSGSRYLRLSEARAGSGLRAWPKGKEHNVKSGPEWIPEPVQLHCTPSVFG